MQTNNRKGENIMKIIKEEAQRAINGGTNVVTIYDSTLKNVVIVQIENIINITNNININVGNIYSKLRKFYHASR